MKNQTSRNQTSYRHSKGFALVVTLSLMILLTIIAVGLLSLSSISLRTASQGEAMATARANARLALMLAIGDLQKSLGPDRAVTATSEILAPNPTTPVSKPNTAGVWESWWDFNPDASPSYATEKTNRFRRWLVSSANPTATTSRDFVTTPWTGKTIELVGNGSLGANATASAKATAGLVPVLNGKTKGSYAWHVSDESVKARINQYRDPSQNTTLAQKRALLAGHRPDPSVINRPDPTPSDEKKIAYLSFLPTDHNADEFVKAKVKSGKLLDLDQVELLEKAKGKAKQFRNDVTPHSLGVLADVRRGGLKQDLSSIFEMSSKTAITLPAEFNAKTLYQSTHGITGVSDPYWSNLAGYYNSFRNIDTPDTNPTVEMQIPSGLPKNPVTLKDSLVLDNPPKNYFPGPIIAKVDTIFNLVARPVSDIWWWGNVGVYENYDYFVDLIYTPVVTLHNPYNVNISFYKMSVEFNNVPIAFNFMFQAGGTVDFVSQSVEPGKFESLNGMTRWDFRGDSKFKMTIANWTDNKPLTPSSAISGLIVMKPGQTLICGPAMDTSKSFKSDGDGIVAFDWGNKLTTNIKAKPSFTPGLGFERNGVAISNLNEDVMGAPGGAGHDWCTFLLLRDNNATKSVKKGTDKFYIQFQAQKPNWYSKWKTGDRSIITQEAEFPSFEVKAEIQATDSTMLTDYAKLEFNYKDDASLKSLFNRRVYRYPPTDSYSGKDISCPPGVTYGQQLSSLHPFAIFSAYARTTNGGVYETGNRSKLGLENPIDKNPQIDLQKDGRLAGKPFLFHNISRSPTLMHMVDVKPAVQPYELNLQPFLSQGDYQDYMNVGADNRVPALTGNTTGRGIKSGSYLEIPTGPMQTIADFRRSNALTSSYLPHFVQPVGNSLLHPLMSSGKVREDNTAISPNKLLDHSVLANHAFYDRFYFSTFATRGTEKPDAVFEKFMNVIDPLATTGAQRVPLPSQSFQPYLPIGKTGADAKGELFASGKPKNTAYQLAAEYQMVQGPFNVNSTSIQAWKAVLASMNKSEVATLWAKNVTLEANPSTGVPILAMSLLNGGSSGSRLDEAEIDKDMKSNNWNGYRELDDAQLTKLAEKIVEQVRLRGPFLSMSEFVNRQVGTDPDPALNLSGALENAISDSGINDNFLAGYVTPLVATDFNNAALYNYTTPAATIGNPAAGAPGWISQGDLLRILEPAATVRSDTFVIRVCGEAEDANGNITARAYAEAVVQRVPEYVDPVDRPSVNAYDITLPTAVLSTASPANKAFGRRMNVVSFRWLSKNEI